MLALRVEDLIEDHMKHYEVDFAKAKEIMIEDIQDAKEEEE